MQKYIDFDGVILDTETGLFDEYYELKKINPNLTRLVYLQNKNWNHWLKQAKIINNSVELLKFYNSDNISILTKVHSLEEASEKIKFLRMHKINNKIIIVPNKIEKYEVVVAKGNILVDDSKKNLNLWETAGGISIEFCQSESDNEYVTINNLEDVLSDKISNNCKVKKIVKSIKN